MEELFEQVKRAVDNRLYYLALFGALVVPDICGAMESPDGQASGQLYRTWFDRYVADKYQVAGRAGLTGEDCYRLRCSMLHQGRTYHPKGRYSRVIFIEPNPLLKIDRYIYIKDSLNVNIRTFCHDVVDAATRWLQDVKGTQEFRDNYPHFMNRYRQGFSPYVNGIPVIT